MLEIHEITDFSVYKEKHDLLKINEPHIIEAIENGNVTGSAIFSYTDDCVYLYSISFGNDLYLCDGIVRTILFKASVKQIAYAEFAVTDENGIKALKKLGFLKSGSIENKQIYIDDFMDNCSCCKKNEKNS